MGGWSCWLPFPPPSGQCSHHCSHATGLGIESAGIYTDGPMEKATRAYVHVALLPGPKGPFMYINTGTEFFLKKKVEKEPKVNMSVGKPY